MDNDFWQSKWQNNDTKFDQATPNSFLLKYLDNLNLKAGARIFVPLCGKSIDMFHLLERGYQVAGVELNLEACKLFFSEHLIKYQIKNSENFTILQSDNITLLVGDFFKLNKAILDKFDAIYDRAALVALPQEMRKAYASHITSLSEKDVEMLLISSSYNQNEMQGPPFSVDAQEVKALYAEHFQIMELYSQAGEIPEHLRMKGLKSVRHHVFKLAMA